MEKLESAIGFNSGYKTCQVGRFIDDDDLYAEKARLQKRFVRENPDEELTRVLSGSSSSTCPAGTADTTICSAGIADATCPIGTVDICRVEEVPAVEWRLTSIAASKVLLTGAREANFQQQQAVVIQALTDTTFSKVCVDT